MIFNNKGVDSKDVFYDNISFFSKNLPGTIFNADHKNLNQFRILLLDACTENKGEIEEIRKVLAQRFSKVVYEEEKCSTVSLQRDEACLWGSPHDDEVVADAHFLKASIEERLNVLGGESQQQCTVHLEYRKKPNQDFSQAEAVKIRDSVNTLTVLSELYAFPVLLVDYQNRSIRILFYADCEFKAFYTKRLLEVARTIGQDDLLHEYHMVVR
ncbi:hypothetical protein CW354_04505 [Marinicaulis flavus]|uniref:Uncharacterized protein n=1 Tax=Hyphococcus luteus TaxID=2058213 RepID=A0A2S7K9M9_9PROT|nr:hypothetical protein CW354_04505 [Marinicaulis flavus]